MNKSSDLEYVATITHEPLDRVEEIRGTDREIVQQEAEELLDNWKFIWRKYLKAFWEKDNNKINELSSSQKIMLAEDLNNSILKEIEVIKNTLAHTLNIDDAINWDVFRDSSKFSKEKPIPPNLLLVPQKPIRLNIEPGFIDKILGKDEKINKDYMGVIQEWEKEKIVIEEKNKSLEELYNYQLKEWDVAKKIYLDKQNTANETIEKRKQEYFNSDNDAIIEYCKLVLFRSEYPSFIKKHFTIDYNDTSEILNINYDLPKLSDIPKVKEVRFIKSRDVFKEIYIASKELDKIYDNLLYQFSLRTIHELFEADQIGAIKSIVFNGWINSFKPSTGKKYNACIMTVQVNKEEFLDINLEKVDPKLCFREIKGISANKLVNLVPIQPILNFERNDRRFIQNKSIVENIDINTNVAAMHWEDFEHLIRELFEREFKSSGGEVKITQASRDGGVDAIAFDPDPIRGGKIVIQAKRYTNTVDLSSVRDLYGTVVNEGASKGILVTTSDFGPEAYNFCKDKPISLINGSNLLFLLNKHGYQATIDLDEAKKLQSIK